jgi:hypothetical protein
LPFYWKTESAFRSYVIGLSGLAAAITVAGFAQATAWSFMLYWYVVIGVVLWIVCGRIATQFMRPLNGWLIRTYGKRQLEKKQRVIARDIVIALFDRHAALDLPEDDEDLVIREAALSFTDFFADQ